MTGLVIHRSTTHAVDDPPDPTRVREQPALTTSTGVIWLIVGGLLSATAIAVLLPMLGLSLPIVAATGIVLVLGLYATMILARVVLHPGRLRLGVMAAAMACIGIAALVCIGAVTAAEWDILR